jgi:small-conductance mechanosensitive channel
MGIWSSEEVFAGVTRATLTAAVAVLIATAMAHLVLRWWVHRKVRRDQALAAGRPAAERTVVYWVDAVLMEAVPPVALLFWVHAVHAALARVLREATFPQALGLVGPLEWVRAVATLLVLIWLLVRIGRVAERWIAGTATGPATTWEGVLLPLAARTVRVFMPLLALFVGAPVLSLSPDLQDILRNAVSLVLIGAAAFLLYQLVEAAGALILTQYQMDTADNLEARKVYTQVTVLKRAALVVISIFTLASMLMVFEAVRQFGTSILASAGVAGIIIGFAAQRSIATLLAGFQIAVTQPIRLDDVVIVEGEWGRIEDITLTYVVVRVWDLRRLVVPITYFIEQPFQNWTRTSAEILGTVFLHVDYSVPLPALREELDRIVTASPHWDGRVKGLIVTEAREQTLEVRALVSAADASLAWDLRCEVREKLIDFLQREYPASLPKVRASLQPMV